MSVSSVSQRPALPPVQHQPAREPVKAAAQETKPKPKAQAQARTEAQPTYSHAKEKPAAPAKGQRVDIKA